MKLPDGWVPVSGEAAAGFETELRREVPTKHLLFGRALRAIARNTLHDDVLFQDSDGALFAVHLTYARETNPAWPWAGSYRDLDDFADRWKEEAE